MAGWWLTGSLADGTPDRPRAVLVAVRADNGPDDSGVCSELLLTELRRLADTDSVAVVAAILQNRHRPDPSAYVATLAPCGSSAEAR